MAFKEGDRVQLTRFYLINRYKPTITNSGEKTLETVGIYVAPAPRPWGVHKGAYCKVHFLTGKKFPPYHPQVIREDYLEPLGTKR